MAILNGSYAITFTNGITRFFQVRTPVSGKWAGYTFLDIQAGSETYPVRDRAKRDAVLRMIAADPEAASAHYGQKIGRCGVCSRPLTDADSRARGIGPVCAGKF